MIGQMMRRRRARFSAVVAAFVVGACMAPRPPAFDAASEGRKLLERDREWAEASSAGKDVERVLAYWTDDAVVMQPGEAPLEGKPAIRAFVTQAFNTPGFKIHWVSDTPTFSADGKMAYLRAVSEVTVPGPKGATMTLHSQGYSIWRMEPDGQWRCVVDISTAAPSPPAPGKT